MKKQVVIIWNDFYHPKEVIAPAIQKLFSEEWEVTTTERLRDLINLEKSPDLAILYTNGRPNGEADITFEEQELVIKKVEAGMGILFYHAGLVLIDEQSPFFLKLNSGRFVHHPEQTQVTVTPLLNVEHPITSGVQPFTQKDEHYFCQVDITRTNLLACATSVDITAASVWCHPFGSGKVAAISQGHTLEMQNDPEMLKLATNTINWLTQSEETNA